MKILLFLFMIFTGDFFGTSHKAFSTLCRDSLKNKTVTDEEIVREISRELSKKERFIEWLLKEGLISPELVSDWLFIKENMTEDKVQIKVRVSVRKPGVYRNNYVSLKELRRVSNLMQGNSLDEPVIQDSTEPLAEILADPNILTPENRLEEEEEENGGWIVDAFNDVLKTYPPKTDTQRLKQIFYERVMATEPITLQEIADRYGVSRQAIDNYEKKLLRRLVEIILTQYSHHSTEKLLNKLNEKVNSTRPSHH